MLVRSAAKPIHSELESGGKSGSQMAEFRLCCFGISGGGGKPGENCFALTRTAMEGDNGGRSFGVKKEIPAYAWAA